ncbi:hypothetical protein AB0C52_12885 [Streptomyces sp. NPDC048717]|uniref:hypothetical protein n=1 Tax=Streptomyces sp. NPDC048717 TaxID=3154928 RepID=UPI0034486BC6
MSVLPVESPAPAGAGQLIVRAAGRLELHIAAGTVELPAAAMFTVPLECHPDVETAPGVRPWHGPLDETRLCPTCRRSLRVEPIALPADLAGRRPPPTGVIGRGLWPVFP